MFSEPEDILIVDDTLENLRVLGDVLRRRGYRVRPVASGALALRACAAQSPDLILLDISMPDMNGFEVASRLKNDPLLNDIPILFISAHTDTEDKVRAFSAGGVDYITKPFNQEEVVARVSTHLALHRQKQELQAQYDRIRELEETRKNLNSLIVHDLRNPLSAVKAYLDLISVRNPGLDDESRKQLHGARDASRQLIDMTNSLLDLNQLEEGSMKLKVESVDLTKLCQEAVTGATPLIGHRTVTVESNSSTVVAEVDRYLVLRVLQNLLGNALKFTDRNSGVITLRVEPGGDDVMVSITDNGPGIPAEYHRRIFEKFVQVQESQIPGLHSTGLGLSLVKLGVEAHGGSVSVESTPGNGTTFRLRIPRSKPEASPAD